MYKYIFVDFDDCLVIHDNGCKLNPTHIDKIRNSYIFKPEKEALEMFNHSRVNFDLLKYITTVSNSETKVIVITEANSQILELKKKYLEKNNIYNYIPEDNLKFISNSSLEGKKVDIIEAYMNQFNISANSLLYIDDNIMNIKDVGFNLNTDILLPQNVQYMLKKEGVL